MAVFTPGFGLLFRFAVPHVANALDRQFGFNLVAYYPLLMSFLPLIAAGMMGTVVGFLLLDQRDDETMTAVLVTPLSVGDYLRYRLRGPMILSVIFGAVIVPLAALTALPLAPIYALFLGTFAANKVQGFALAKAVGVNRDSQDWLCDQANLPGIVGSMHGWKPHWLPITQPDPARLARRVMAHWPAMATSPRRDEILLAIGNALLAIRHSDIPQRTAAEHPAFEQGSGGVPAASTCRGLADQMLISPACCNKYVRAPLRGQVKTRTSFSGTQCALDDAHASARDPPGIV